MDEEAGVGVASGGDEGRGGGAEEGSRGDGLVARVGGGLRDFFERGDGGEAGVDGAEGERLEGEGRRGLEVVAEGDAVHQFDEVIGGEVGVGEDGLEVEVGGGERAEEGAFTRGERGRGGVSGGGRVGEHGGMVWFLGGVSSVWYGF